MDYHIKQVANKFHIKQDKSDPDMDIWIVYTSGRTYNEWVFPNEKSARKYLNICKGLVA